LRLSLPGKKQSRADFPFTDVWILYEITPNAFFEWEIGSAIFLARPTQTQTALGAFVLLALAGSYQHTFVHECTVSVA
jgi:hypothetical protein